MKPVNKMFSDKSINVICQKYDATYIIDSCIRSGESWRNFPAAFFYTKEPHPQGSNYFAIYKFEMEADYEDPEPTFNGFMITNGICITEGVFNGFLFEDGELVHSRFRHDYFVHREAMVDGGRDYFRCGERPEGAKSILFKVDGPDLVKIDQ